MPVLKKNGEIILKKKKKKKKFEFKLEKIFPWAHHFTVTTDLIRKKKI